MADVSTANLTDDAKNPRLARADILDAIQRLNRNLRIIVLPESDVLSNVVLIDSNGRVGIGGAVDAAKLLKLYGDFTFDGVSRTLYTNKVAPVSTSAALVISSLAARLSLAAGGSSLEYLGIDPTSGSVQIGGSSAATNPLSVYGNSATVASATFRQDGNGNVMEWVGASGVLKASMSKDGVLTALGNKAVNASTASTFVYNLADSTVGNLPTIMISNGSAPADRKLFLAQVTALGVLNLKFASDDLTTSTSFMTVTRTGNTALNFTLTATKITTDGEVAFFKSYTENSIAVTAAATTTIDCSLGNVFAVAMNASITTLTINNVPASGRVYNMTLKLKQDGTGSRSVTWPASVKWAGGAAPTLTSGANKVDYITLYTDDGGANWHGFVGGLNYS